MDHDAGGGAASAFRFTGGWRDYAPIAFTNLLLTIVTLGFYRFWATTRTRQYLWSRTHFIDESLEWTGTGKELLVGFGMAALLFGLPFLFIQFGVRALAMQGHPGIAGVLSFLAFLFILMLTGVARFRALRYRLSRTYWHGIRGGSDSNGLTYGISWLWKSAVGVFPLWLLVPWSMMSLWNERWRQMSFGSHSFRAEGRSGPTYKRFLLFYLAPFLFVIVAIGVGVVLWSTFGSVNASDPRALARILLHGAVILSMIAIFFGIYILLGLIALAYYAAYLREAIGHVSLGGIDFHFDATTGQWLRLFFGDVALVLFTLGIGVIFLSYRHWKFFITHLEATGEVSLSALGQSMTREPRQGEGLLDAFDLGAL